MWKEKGAAGARVGDTDGAHGGGRKEGNQGRGREITGERKEAGGVDCAGLWRHGGREW